jgi:hypothetical protein
MFFQNVGSYESHKALTSQKMMFLTLKLDLKVCDNGISVQLLCFWTLPIMESCVLNRNKWDDG